MWRESVKQNVTYVKGFKEQEGWQLTIFWTSVLEGGSLE